MARWTSTAAQDLKWAGYRFTGAAGTVFSIADEQKASFDADPGPTIAGFAWTNSFPAAPVTGQREWRADRGEWCYYDGTRWLGPEGIIQFDPDVSGPISASSFAHTVNPGKGLDILLLGYSDMLYGAAPQTAPNYWYFWLKGLNNGGTTQHDIFGGPFLDTNTMAVSVWNSLYNAVTPTVVPWANNQTLNIYITKNGAPGSIYYAVKWHYRPIIT